MTKKRRSKAATCKYNLNRHALKIVHPLCNWKPTEFLVLPPSVYWGTDPITERDCTRCKAYVHFDTGTSPCNEILLVEEEKCTL